MKRNDNHNNNKLIVLFSTFLCLSLSTLTFSLSVGHTKPLPLKAAIVDQGSLAPTSGPNPAFVKEATAILKKAGFNVDYYPGEEVTVEFYRKLPNYGYDFIILRTHSDMFDLKSNILASMSDSSSSKGDLCIFTNERLEKVKIKKYLSDVKDLRLVGSFYKKGDEKKGDVYFGITPTFVSKSMQGKFNDTTVIMMGCEGLKNKSMAEAYIQKGCKFYISWNNLLLSEHSDKATIDFLQNLLLEKLSVKNAVLETMRKIGPDPTYKSILLFYPIYPEEAQFLIPEYKSIMKKFLNQNGNNSVVHP